MQSVIERRSVLALGALAAGVVAGGNTLAQYQSQAATALPAIPSDAPKVAMLIYPKMVALDLIGPIDRFQHLAFQCPTCLEGQKVRALCKSRSTPRLNPTMMNITVLSFGDEFSLQRGH